MECSHPFVSVIIPAHNEEKYISECLSSISRQSYPRERYEIIIIDNGSTDKTVELANKFNVKVFQKKEGPVGAVRNYGTTKAKGEIFAFLDSDCIAPENWISTGVGFLKQNSNIVFGGGYLLREHPYWIERFWLLENDTLPKDLLGGAIFITRKLFDEVGQFSERITSGEDTKISEDLRSSGHQVILKRELSVIHLGNPITLRHFIKRQIWHSENYFQNMKGSIVDPTFYILISFSIFIVGIVLSIFLGKTTQIYIFMAAAALLPVILSAKRIFRSSHRTSNLGSIPFIYILDFCYLLGRTVGLTKSIWKLLDSVRATKR